MDKVNTILDRDRWLDSSKQCYDVMYAVARSFQVQTVVEIGSYQGCSAISFCQGVLDNGGAPDIYCVDAYFHDGKDISDTILTFHENTCKAGVANYIKLYHGKSEDHLPKIFDEIDRADLCFIDGDHSLEGVRRDYDLCKGHTDLILFHDVTSFGHEDFLSELEEEGWSVMIFPTKYVEGDGHPVGIALAVRR